MAGRLDGHSARRRSARTPAARHLDFGESALTLFTHFHASRRIARRVAGTLVAGTLMLAPATLRAQDAPRPDSLSPDSLAARLARAEAAIAALRQQMATESQSSVHTRSRLQLELTGRILTNTFGTYGRANNVDVPLVALAPSNVLETNAFGITARQTRVGGVVSVLEVLGGEFVGDLDIDFFGGVQSGPGDRRLFPEPRLRTTRARLIWSRTEIMVGMDDPLVSLLNPVSLAAVGVPEFSGSANLWNWLGQIRLSQAVGTARIANTPVRFTLQGEVIAPFSGSVYPDEPDAVDAGERSARPAFEARLQSRWGDSTLVGGTDASIGNGGGEIGISTHRGWVATGDGELQSSYAYAMDARINIVPRVELRGEAYVGRLVRGLGGGGINQAFGRSAVVGELGPPIRDRAAWGQLNAQLLRPLLGSAGCGVDVVNPDDRPVRQRNAVCATSLLWRPSEPIVVGLEYRHVSTHYDAGGTGRVNAINLALGFEL